MHFLFINLSIRISKHREFKELILTEISVILPVYNAVSFIEKCIESILNQTFFDFEVIVVNDGSTDGSDLLLDELAKRDHRLRIFHQVNRGVSYSRNKGLEIARGRWISFCDADDYLNSNMFEELLGNQDLNFVDWVICNSKNIYGDHKDTTRLKELNDGVFSLIDCRALFVEDLMKFKYDYANWNKLYKSSIIKGNFLSFNEGMHIWEDLLFNLKYAHFASNVLVLNSALYNYRVQAQSLSSNNNSKFLITNINDLFLNYRQFTDEFKAEEEFGKFNEQITRISYFELLNKCEVEILDNFKSSYRLIFLNYLTCLRLFLPKIWKFGDVDRNFSNQLKRNLLTHRWFKVLSTIFIIKIFCKNILAAVNLKLNKINQLDDEV